MYEGAEVDEVLKGRIAGRDRYRRRELVLTANRRALRE